MLGNSGQKKNKNMESRFMPHTQVKAVGLTCVNTLVAALWLRTEQSTTRIEIQLY